MRTLILFSLVFSSLPFVSASAQVTQDSIGMTGHLTIIVQGLNSDNGTVQIGLFNSEETWKAGRDEFKATKIGIINGKAVWDVENIPYGFYAVRLFHDENNNDKMDTNFLGIPVESYGFSNNAKGLFGPPDFDKAKFVLDAQHHETMITVE